MLVLSRRIGEVIKINDDIDIKILGVDECSRCVKIGIAAPLKHKVHRKEIYDRIKSEGGSLKDRMKAQGLPIDDIIEGGE